MTSAYVWINFVCAILLKKKVVNVSPILLMISALYCLLMKFVKFHEALICSICTHIKSFLFHVISFILVMGWTLSSEMRTGLINSTLCLVIELSQLGGILEIKCPALSSYKWGIWSQEGLSFQSRNICWTSVICLAPG